MYKIIVAALYVGLAGPAAAWSFPTCAICKLVALDAQHGSGNAKGSCSEGSSDVTPLACLIGKIAGADEQRRLVQTARLDRSPSTLSRSGPQKSQTELDDLVAYYTQQLIFDPKDDDAYFHRGIAKFYGGSASDAIADIGKAYELDPAYPYYAVWLQIIQARSGIPSHLAEDVSHVDMTKWPAPVIKLLLGQMAGRAVLAAATDPDTAIQMGQVCEANFYIGQLEMLKNSRREAERWFRLAALGCPQDFVEGPAARAELRALGAWR